MAVDAVHDVVVVPETDIESTPDIGLRLKSQYLTGIARVRTRCSWS
jgi:chemotaxis signal transduction protein